MGVVDKDKDGRTLEDQAVDYFIILLRIYFYSGLNNLPIME